MAKAKVFDASIAEAYLNQLNQFAQDPEALAAAITKATADIETAKAMEAEIAAITPFGADLTDMIGELVNDHKLSITSLVVNYTPSVDEEGVIATVGSGWSVDRVTFASGQTYRKGKKVSRAKDASGEATNSTRARVYNGQNYTSAAALAKEQGWYEEGNSQVRVLAKHGIEWDSLPSPA